MSRHSRARFEAIVDLLPTVGVVADIGAGDLDLARLVLARGRAGRVIAVERAFGAYMRAARRAAGDARLDLRRGDGFEPVRAGEADAAVLAGLGGRAIARILRRACVAAGESLASTIVVAPNADEAAARAALSGCGLVVVEEALVAEGTRVRPILLAVRQVRLRAGGPRLGGELEVDGPTARRRPGLGQGRGPDPLLAAYVSGRTAALRRELSAAQGERARALAQAIAEAEARL